MNVLILMGSPRYSGNTAQCTDILADEVKSAGHNIETILLYDKNLQPCIACRKCQESFKDFSCSLKDDLSVSIFQKILDCDLLVLATPIYSWFCTPPMKAVLDRLVYGMNKYYGDVKGPSLWEGKPLACLVTCGYPPEKGADLFGEAMKRYCRHSKLDYKGLLALRHEGYDTTFMTDEKVDEIRSFAQKSL